MVVRYFGGTKLGVPGLFRAYKSAAAESLLKSIIVVVTIMHDIMIMYSYDKTNEVMILMSEFDVEINDHSFEEECKIVGKILPSKYEIFRDNIGLIQWVSLK